MNINERLDYFSAELQDKSLAAECLKALDPVANIGHHFDDAGFSYSGDTRDRHYIRLWEALHTNDKDRLAFMATDWDYCSLMPFMHTVLQLKMAEEANDQVRVLSIKKELARGAS
jgi:hypothetical protein